MLEKIIPIIKYIFFNFEFFLIITLAIVWFILRKKPTGFLNKKIISLGDFIYKFFIKLSETKPLKLLLLFFILNFIIRLLMASVVPDISLDKLSPHYLNLAKSLYLGEGFTTKVIWLNFLQDPQIIRPDFFRMPFYPILIALAYKIFGVSYLAAQLVNVIAGSLLPIIAYLFAYVLTKSKKVSTLLLIFISFNTLILSWVAIAWPEIVYCCLAIFLLYCLYLTKEKNKTYPLLTGVLLALTYLTRSEALYIFLPVILLSYFYQQNKRKFLIKLSLTVLGFLIIATPYLARNYILTGKPFYTEFDKILLVSYVGDGYLVESPSSEYKNVYDLFFQQPIQTSISMAKILFNSLISLPKYVIGSYLISILTLMGMWLALKKEWSKYLFLFLAMLLGFILPGVIIFTDRYFIILIVLFYLFVCLGVTKLYDNLAKDKLLQAMLIIYLSLFIAVGALVGIGKGTLPYIPHSFYKRFNADQYFTD
ncbi:MAG: glycosyltransferase family 39 protein, partial [Candidatus Buchananbacteria bacterium]